MSYVDASSSINTQTLSLAGVQTRFAGTPLEDYAEAFVYYAQQYEIDVNWAVSYLRWESGYGGSQIGRSNPTNPWDILCYQGQWGAIGGYEPGNGYCYAVYPDALTGIEAGFRQWRVYLDKGYTSWHDSLCVGVSGWDLSGCNEGWVNNVIATGQQNAQEYPFDGVSAPPPTQQPQQPGPAPEFSPQMVFPVALAAVGIFILLRGLR